VPPWIVAIFMVLAVTACNNTKASTSHTTPSPGSGASSNSTAQCTVPQNNGGDHDADNNGGPDDGDGCDK
jgi:hypothetical protein